MFDCLGSRPWSNEGRTCAISAGGSASRPDDLLWWKTLKKPKRKKENMPLCGFVCVCACVCWCRWRCRHTLSLMSNAMKRFYMYVTWELNWTLSNLLNTKPCLIIFATLFLHCVLTLSSEKIGSAVNVMQHRQNCNNESKLSVPT